MNSFKLMILLLLALCCLPCAAQQDEIYTIRVKKPAPADTGRYRSPIGWEVYDGFPRPMCGFRGFDPPPHVYFIAGYEYHTYSYLKLGVRTATPLRFQTYFGANVQGNIDHTIIGLGVFGEKLMYSHEPGRYWVGVRANSFMQASGDFHTLAPYVSCNINRPFLEDFHLSYGYNFVLADNTEGPEGSPRPGLKINTHSFTITYILPFYL